MKKSCFFEVRLTTKFTQSPTDTCRLDQMHIHVYGVIINWVIGSWCSRLGQCAHVHANVNANERPCYV